MRCRPLALLIAGSIGASVNLAAAECDLGETGVGRFLYNGEVAFVAVSSVENFENETGDRDRLKAILIAKNMIREYISAEKGKPIAGMVTVGSCAGEDIVMARVAWSPRLASAAKSVNDETDSRGDTE